MELILSARSKTGESTDYTGLEKHGLSASVQLTGGTGGPKEPFLATVTVRNDASTAWTGVIHVELPFPKTAPRYFLPAFMYGTNRGEAPLQVPKQFPRLRDGNPPRPASPWWMVRSDRLSHPAAFVYDNGIIYGLSASPYFIRKDGRKQQWNPDNEGVFYQYGGYSCSLSKGTVGYTLGYENAPWLFIKATLVKERAPLEDNCFELAAGEAVSFALELYEYEAESELGVNAAMQEIYYRYHQSPRKAGDPRTAVADLSQAIYRYAWLPKELSYSGFVIEDKANGGYRYNKIFSLSWTNGLSVAVPVLMAALRLEEESMRQQALICIDNMVEHSLNPQTGLPFEAYDNDGIWSNRGWWFDGMHTPGHSSYLIGQAAYYILKAYDYENRLKQCVHDDWLDFVTNILVRMEETKNTDGEYPYILSNKTGAGLEYDAFSGAWCMAAMAYRSWLTGDKTYLASLRRSEKHYHEAYIQRMECYGSPLDADKAVDSEGILAYIKAVRYLHALTGDQLYLSHMRDAINYEFSFKFCYNSPVKIPPLSKVGWSSSGGSVTSTANPHIHPMSSNIVDELLYYVENTGDLYVRSRMKDTVDWGCQTYNRYDNEFDYGKKGWMSERFCHSEGLVTEVYSDGSPASTWFCLMPWASGCIIESLAGDLWEYEHLPLEE
ncbi:hypothetical protein [Paenibacillus silviterrae]|uniref:hypothetical protein n=1 Tax=Paenibacillus silviterrae TaxID=3242194 RepID=UPI0025432757|nr:hypothetical protein [Paenibacillus chinjuensis]